MRNYVCTEYITIHVDFMITYNYNEHFIASSVFSSLNLPLNLHFRLLEMVFMTAKSPTIYTHFILLNLLYFAHFLCKILNFNELLLYFPQFRCQLVGCVRNLLEKIIQRYIIFVCI